MQDVTALFDAMTADERNEFLALLIDEHKQNADLRALNAIATAANGAIGAVLTRNDRTFVDDVKERRQKRGEI